jgi:hypothetical protein
MSANPYDEEEFPEEAPVDVIEEDDEEAREREIEISENDFGRLTETEDFMEDDWN